MTADHANPVCAVVGVGPGIGEELARRFSQAGWALALLARRADRLAGLAADLPHARAYPCDAGDEGQVGQVFEAIAREQGPVEVLAYNAGPGVWGAIEAVTVADFEAAWRTNTLGLFLTARAVIPEMTARGFGSIIVTGATASMRGGAAAAAFAPAKAGQRALAQSLARHLGPRGVHVAHIVVDGVVGGAETRSRFPDRPDDRFIDPAAIADVAFQLVHQPRSAWSFEVDVRPFNEGW